MGVSEWVIKEVKTDKFYTLIGDEKDVPFMQDRKGLSFSSYREAMDELMLLPYGEFKIETVKLLPMEVSE